MKLLTPKSEREWKARMADALREVQLAEQEVKECESTLAEAKRRHAVASNAVVCLLHEDGEIKRQAQAKVEEANRAKRRAEAVAEKLKPYAAEIARLTEERGRHNSEGNVAGVAALDTMILQKKEQRRQLATA